MGFVATIRNGFANYATFQGRACRSEYWWWYLFNILVVVAAAILDALLTKGSTRGGTGNILTSLAYLVVLLPGLAVFVRRLHDTDHSGWWYFITFTVVGAVFPLFVWSCQRGTTGPNRFGDDPLGGTFAATPYPAHVGGVPLPGGPSASFLKVEELGRLRDKGLITQAEFDEHKKRVLDRF